MSRTGATIGPSITPEEENVVSKQETVHQLVAEALLDLGWSQGEVVIGAAPIADSLTRTLVRHGLGIHITARCARLPVSDLGRPMTEDEMATVGLT